jgi:polyhydroxybutyrate depolymerase
MRRYYVTLALAAPVLLGSCFVRRGDAGDGARNFEGKMSFGGIERTFVLHLPRGHDKSKPAPLVIALHGGSGTGEGFPRLTQHGFDDLADRDGWIVVYPDGVGKNWNDGRKVERSEAYKRNVDDVGFISALIDELATWHNIDGKRVYATGISNGGFMSHRLARDLSSKIAAIAPVAANLHVAEDVASVPSRAVSVLAINGTKDPLVPFEGGSIHLLMAKRGLCRSTRETIDWWVKTDGCAAEPVVTMDPDNDPDDGTRVRREVHAGGRDGSEVILLEIQDGGHTWPGGVQYAPELLIGRTCRDIDANQEIWAFFARHALP